MQRLYILLLIGLISGSACALNNTLLGGQPVAPVTAPIAEPNSTSIPPQVTVTASPSPSSAQYVLNLPSAKNGLARLDTYRASLIVDFEGTRHGLVSAGHIESLTELNHPARALHHYLNVAGNIPDSPSPNPNNNFTLGISEFFQVEDTIYTNQAGQSLSFSQAKTDQISAQDLGFPQLEQLMILPEKLSEAPQIETLNGVMVQHYRFTEDDLKPTTMVIKQAQGEVWVAERDAYILQYVISATVKLTAPLPNAQIIDEGWLRLSYILTDINSEVLIPPPDLLAVTITPLTNIPRPDDAQLTTLFPALLEYNSAISPVSATLFYRQTLPDLGWTAANIEVYEEKSRLVYTNTQQSLTIVVAPASGANDNKISLSLETQ